MGEYHALLVIAGSMAFAGWACLFAIWLRNRDAFELLPYKSALVDLFSHLPDASTGPSLHVIGTVLLVSGVSFMIATPVSDLTTPDQLLGSALGIGSILLSVSFSAISVWTLWQARRIDFQYGYRITDFYQLILAANVEIAALLNSYRESYGGHAQKFHRFYLVTAQPMFGTISYPNQPATVRFTSLMREMSDCAGSSSPFDMQVICGTRDTIEDLHKKMVNKLNLPDEEKNRRITEYTDNIEREIKGICDKVSHTGRVIFFRKQRVPRVQFMIIGNKLFEFTIDNSGQQSEVHNAQVLTDSRYCSAYVEMFEILKEHV